MADSDSMRPVEKLTPEMCPVDAPPLYTLDQICGQPTGDGGDRPVWNLAQLAAFTLAVGEEGAKLNQTLMRNPIWGDRRWRKLDRYRATFDRLVGLMPPDLIDGTTDVFSHT